MTVGDTLPMVSDQQIPSIPKMTHNNHDHSVMNINQDTRTCILYGMQHAKIRLFNRILKGSFIFYLFSINIQA